MYPSPEQIAILYAERDAAIMRLAAKGTVDTSDLTALDRLGRFRVVVELWAVCTEAARAALLADQHPHVRSAACLATPHPQV